jgi:alpha/beta superfamily hydrolase
MTTTLLSPGLAFPVARFQAGEDSSGFLSLEDSSLVLFGSSDHFTLAKKLKQWAERLSTNSAGRLQWQCFEGADHFWRGDKILEDLQARTRIWVSGSMSS